MKTLLTTLLTVVFLSSFGQAKYNIYNSGNSIVITMSGDTLTTFQKDGLQVASPDNYICQFKRDRRVLLQFPYTSVAIPTLTSGYSFVTIVGAYLSSIGTITLDSVVFSGGDTLSSISFKNDTLFLNSDTIPVGSNTAPFYVNNSLGDSLFVVQTTGDVNGVINTDLSKWNFSIGSLNNSFPSASSRNIYFTNNSVPSVFGTDNIVLGYNAAQYTSNYFSRNIVIGYNSCNQSSQNSYVISIGGSSLQRGGGDATTSIGDGCGYNNKYFYSVLNGHRSAHGSGNVTNCTYITTLGYRSLYGIPSNASNIISIGAFAGENSPESNSIYIHTSTSALTDSKESLIYGKITADSTFISFNGGLRLETIEVSSDSTALSINDYRYNVSYTATDSVVIYIPSSVAVNEQTFVITDIGGKAATNGIRVYGSGLINGASNYIINSNYESITISCWGGNWYIE